MERLSVEEKHSSICRPSEASKRPASRASVMPRSVRSTSTQPVNLFARFHSLWPWRTSTSVACAAAVLLSAILSCLWRAWRAGLRLTGTVKPTLQQIVASMCPPSSMLNQSQFSANHRLIFCSQGVNHASALRE